jgi:hypothetical protein
MNEMRQMRLPPFPINAHRDGRWTEVKSTDVCLLSLSFDVFNRSTH